MCSFALCQNAAALILYFEHNYKWNKCASRPSIVNRTYSVHLFFCFNSHIISNLPCAHRNEWQTMTTKNYTQKYYWWPCTAMRSRLQQSIVHSNVFTMDDASGRQTAKVHEWRNRTANRTFSTGRSQTSRDLEGLSSIFTVAMFLYDSVLSATQSQSSENGQTNNKRRPSLMANENQKSRACLTGCHSSIRSITKISFETK